MKLPNWIVIKPFDHQENYGDWRLTYEVGDLYGEESEPFHNYLKINIASKYAITVRLPLFIKAQEERIYPSSWTDQDKARLGRDYYTEYHKKAYGVTFTKDHAKLEYGVQRFCELNGNKSIYLDYNWKEHTYKQAEYFDDQGKLFRVESAGERLTDIRELTPKVKFLVEDEDGSEIVVETHLIKRTWSHGRKFFSFLKYFKKNLEVTTLEINFANEVGPDKGSWKGGLIGTGCKLLPEEVIQPGVHEAVFKRFCDMEHRAKYGTFKLKYKGMINEATI